MFAVSAVRFAPDDPLSAMELGERPEPIAKDGWVTVDVKAASLNHHDLWSLRGVGLKESQLPMILGCDAAGLDPDGNEVIVHALIGDPDYRGDETMDPGRSLLSERHQGTFAEQVVVPRRNLSPRPPACRRPGSPPTGCCSTALVCNPARRCSCRAPAAGWPRRVSRWRTRP